MNDYHFQSPGADGRASWTFVDLDPGMYRVSATWFAWHNRATNAAFRAFDGTFSPGDTSNLAWTVPVDQTMAPDGTHAANWQEIGLIEVSGDTAVVDVLSGLSNGFVIADAVRLDFLGNGGRLRAVTAAPAATAQVVTLDPASTNLKSEISNRKSAPPSRITDALFARWDDTGDVTTVYDDAIAESDDSSDETEDGLELKK